MNTFTIRVVLHEGTWQDYFALEEDLAKKGIVDVIAGSDGNAYKMPPAEYNYIGPETIEQVREMARASAAKIGKFKQVFVTQASQQAWVGLEVVQQRRTA